MTDSQYELVEAVKDLVHKHGEMVVCFGSGMTHAEIQPLEAMQERAVWRLAKIIFGDRPSVAQCRMIDPDFRGLREFA